MHGRMLVHIKCMFLTENINIVSFYLTNWEPCQGVVLQLDVVREIQFTKLSPWRESTQEVGKTAAKQLRQTNSQFTALFEEFWTRVLCSWRFALPRCCGYSSKETLNTMQGCCSSSVEWSTTTPWSPLPHCSKLILIVWALHNSDHTYTYELRHTLAITKLRGENTWTGQHWFAVYVYPKNKS